MDNQLSIHIFIEMITIKNYEYNYRKQQEKKLNDEIQLIFDLQQIYYELKIFQIYDKKKELKISYVYFYNNNFEDMKIKHINEVNENEQPSFQINPLRWFVLFTYFFLAFSNVLQFVSYSPIWANAAIYYNIQTQDLQWLGNMYYLTYFILSPLFIKPLMWRFDLLMYLAGILTAIGTWIIYIGGQSFTIALVGFFVVGVSEAIFLQVPVYLAECYFSVYQRAIAICIGSYAVLAGLAFSYTFSSFYFFQILDQLVINQKIEEMNFIIAILNTIAGGFCIIFFRGNPNKQIQEENIVYSMVKTFSNEEWVLDLLAFSMCINYYQSLDIGVGWSYITIVSLQLANYGFDQSQVGITGIVYQFSGVIVGIYASLKIDQDVKQGIQPDYDYYLKSTTTLGFVFLILQSFLINRFNFVTLLIFNFFIGVGLNTLYPLAMCAFCEKLYPLNSLWLVTIILILANLLGFILNYIIILPILLPYSLWISLVVITPFQLYFIFFYKTKYRKFESI
ncbi:hypothetical protein pb186bvf_007093 [Paramecium bursaria]